MKFYTTSDVAVVGVQVRERGRESRRVGERGTVCARERRQVVAIIAVEMFGIVAAKFMQKCHATIKIQSVSNSCQLNVRCIRGVCAICKAVDNSSSNSNTATVCVDYTVHNTTTACCNL